MGNKKKRSSSGFSTARVMKIIRLAALVGPGAHAAMQPVPMEEKVVQAVELYTGYHIRQGTFRTDKLALGWGPFLMASVITYGIPKLTGILRRL